VDQIDAGHQLEQFTGEMAGWQGIGAPANAPPQIIAILRSAPRSARMRHSV
jgi:hypothetical protein